MKIASAIALLAAFVVAVPQRQISFQTDSTADNSRLIETAPGVRAWMAPEEVGRLLESEIKFMDVTDFQDLDAPFAQEAFTGSSVNVPQLPRFPSMVLPLLTQLKADNIEKSLTTFSSFHNRYYDSEYGLQSAEWLFGQVESMAKASTLNVTVRKFPHTWKQFSIVARFEGEEYADQETVIVGAHQDSLNMRDRMNGRAPGADDDGSGTTTILEAFRVLCSSPSFAPRRPVEFHWYSAEELGLLGSQAVAAEYKKNGRSVLAMLQNDMTGFVPKAMDPHFGVVMDFTDSTTTVFLKKLIEKYTGMDWVETKCGYACSDHASWLKAGYRSVFPFEGRFTEHSPNVHTPQDDLTTVSFEHMLEFSKLALSFAVELSQ